MGVKITYSLIFIFLFLLQGCSGGRVGNFFESSFNNIDDNSQINNKQKLIQDNKINQNVDKQNDEFYNKEKSEPIESKKDTLKLQNSTNQNNKLISNDSKYLEKSKIINKNKKSKKIKKYKPYSYRIIVILNEVDPSSPTEKFSNALKLSDITFEIEKIERLSVGEVEKTNKSKI